MRVLSLRMLPPLPLTWALSAIPSAEPIVASCSKLETVGAREFPCCAVEVAIV